MDDPGNDAHGRSYTHDTSIYALGGKIMVSAVIVLFSVLLFILCLHVYARCFLLRRRRDDVLRRRRMAHFVFVSEGTVMGPVPSRGLDATVLRSLPVFVYSSNSNEEPLECAVCLSQFQENEKGRNLPKCNHSFHIECIDMWFHSHSTCPICRAAISLEAPEEIVITVESVSDSETAPSSNLCESCRHPEGTAPSSSSSNSNYPSLDSSSSKTKAQGFSGLRLEVPMRNGSFTNLGVELSLVSPGGPGLKSPGSRILSLKRILNREMRFSPTALSCNSGPGIDIEQGEEEHGAQLQR
ncbi:RING-H2 finger protein ATL64-like [Aristolochia californica]|uniref:RING-H2 finger protein ATL64-like n=1 Tax=Aristolochia californica TaxID=171875 RepID=UPI0035E37B09